MTIWWRRYPSFWPTPRPAAFVRFFMLVRREDMFAPLWRGRPESRLEMIGMLEALKHELLSVTFPEDSPDGAG